MVISTNFVSLFLIKHDQNGVGDCNLLFIQGSMFLDDTAVSKSKQLCADFPNIAILNKSATLGGFQVMYAHTSIGNKSLG